MSHRCRSRYSACAEISAPVKHTTVRLRLVHNTTPRATRCCDSETTTKGLSPEVQGSISKDVDVSLNKDARGRQASYAARPRTPPPASSRSSKNRPETENVRMPVRGPEPEPARQRICTAEVEAAPANLPSHQRPAKIHCVASGNRLVSGRTFVPCRVCWHAARRWRDSRRLCQAEIGGPCDCAPYSQAKDEQMLLTNSTSVEETGRLTQDP